MTSNNSEIAPADEGFSLIPRQKLLALYSAMMRCRTVAERPAIGRKIVNSLLGHEAAAVGAAIDLLPEDAVVSAVWPEEALLAINPRVSTPPSIAAALRSARADRSGRQITVLFSNGRQTRQKHWADALAQAAGHKLPFLFVRLSGPDQSHKILVDDAVGEKGKKDSLPLIPVDGDDVVAVYRVASEAIAHARKGHGPTLIDCRISRSGDPLANMENYLRNKGLEPPQK